MQAEDAIKLLEQMSFLVKCEKKGVMSVFK